MSANHIQSEQTILGYTLKERVGAGGYGEVWSATAPGGIDKAIKFVYGYHDEARAQSELKALERIKDVRHPFLLSLERIDIYNGQLVVVTELADKSLADLYNEFAAKGEQGIPREELLKYVRDTADALDYLGDSHQLQHLDIKPENLLMVSGHVKVADFGLVKELGDGSISLMAGMTPAYAAPELFDGRPCYASDQYSLAIVYQEMLTSVRPFPGTTPAQLAAQHMHGRPNLRPLPQGDQSVIARALAKDPNARFESCRAMVEELVNRKRRKKITGRASIKRMSPNTAMKNDVRDPRDRDVTAVISQSSIPFQSIDIQTLDPPPNHDPQSAVFQPTIVLSIGNTANKVNQLLKQRLIARHGSMDHVPSIQILCMDSDRNALGILERDGGRESLAPSETVDLPLFKPENYRDRSSTHLKWLSRRWIYNVPRSLQTEGLRPLGRLAFADHFDQIWNKIQKTIETVTDEDGIATTCESIGMNPATKICPRIFILSSISGGIGSGMSLDLAYTVKMVLAENGYPTETVNGFFMHSTNSRARDPGLSAANAFAFLTELRHYNDNGYPGDGSLGMPEIEEGPIDNCYYLELGNDLTETQLSSRLNEVSEYVYLNSLTNCSSFFDACHKEVEDNDHFSLRTFGISIAGPGIQITGNHLKNKLARGMINRWIHGSSDENEKNRLVEKITTHLMDETCLNQQGIEKQVATVITATISNSKWNEICGPVSKLVQNPNTNIKQIQDYFDRVVGLAQERRYTNQTVAEFSDMLDHAIISQSTQAGDLLATDILDSIDGKRLSLAVPKATIDLCTERISAIRDHYDENLTTANQRLAQLEQEFSHHQAQPAKNKSDEFLSDWLQKYSNERRNEMGLRYAKDYCRAARNCLRSPQKTLQDLTHQLRILSDQFQDFDEISERVTGGEISLDEMMAGHLEKTLDQCIDRAELQVYENLIVTVGGYMSALSQMSCIRNTLPAEIRYVAGQVLADTYRKLSIDEIIEEYQVDPDQLATWLNRQMNLARPIVSECGGGMRFMIGLPAFSKDSKIPQLIEDKFEVKPAAIAGTSGDFILCFEGEDVVLANVAFRLMEQRPDAEDLSRRIHTRNDVDWSSLNDLF